MTIVIMTVGTEGDVRPHIALAQAMVKAGLDVRLAADRGFSAAVAAAGIAFAPLTADFAGMMRRNPQALGRGKSTAAARVVIRETREMARHWPAEAAAAAQGASLLIGSGNISLVAASLAEKYDIPFVQTQLQPLDSSRALPPVWLPPRRLPGAVNLALHRLLRQTAWLLTRGIANDMRRTLQLPPYPVKGPWHNAKATGGKVLFGFSPHVVPRQPEWAPRIAMPGYFVLPPAADFTPPDGLADFLAAGERPVYIGFGSMHTAAAPELAAIIKQAVRLIGRRAVVGSGWAQLGDYLGDDPHIFCVGSISHEWLFPRVAAAVHHCGAGTAAAAVRAGIPTVPVPFVGDQYFWGWQLGQAGVATPALDLRNLNAPALAEAISDALSPQMRDAAAALGEKVRAENGAEAAITQLRAWDLL
ncbi:glycosyltransferase [Ketogulonicigenium vulgare]|uniref:Glycosyl transferase, putative n=1 Tax=Ketogulonicigenium vulgare (strain WSH-001) TaxID=759362 RepID=F9Y827_KETVW|nr:glycosyltransferase [Ketogulonicigenium vulgare]AEM41153.1 Glycosyl transferase, putative [Ketogulonicigenium vulgare WSH-001]ALJ81291.1 glycosyl hydrolase [Ketogulonicigenium vulgare]ANW34029.1 glycosyl hydrolase [Ketogulonicigenium vulgare]AOZ54875.1 Glycosyl transferase, putative [Ketogulonicigenium vulgare]